MDFSKIITWIKKHKWKSALIGVCSFFAPLILVHLLYKWVTPHYILQSDWDSGDLITYIAGFEAFVGTVFLGTATVLQNQKANKAAETANKLSKQMLENENKRDTFSRQPCVMLSDIRINNNQSITDIKALDAPVYDLKGLGSSENSFEKLIITITLINASPVFSEIQLKSLICQRSDNDPNRLSCNGSRDFPHINAIYIAPENEGRFYFSFHSETIKSLAGFDCSLELLLSNSIYEKYKETIKFTILNQYHDKIIISTTNYTTAKLLNKKQ